MRDKTWKKLQPLEHCPTCGEAVTVGGWPFCASKVNPEGHRKGTYRWGVQSILSKKWWRVGK